MEIAAFKVFYQAMQQWEHDVNTLVLSLETAHLPETICKLSDWLGHEPIKASAFLAQDEMSWRDRLDGQSVKYLDEYYADRF